MRPLLIALALTTAPLAARAGGLMLPGSVGYGSPAASTSGAPTAVQACAAAAFGCSLGAAPAQNNLLWACSTNALNSAPGLNTGWAVATGAPNQKYGVINYIICAYKFAGPSEPATQTPFTSNASDTEIYEIGNLSSTVISAHYTAGGVNDPCPSGCISTPSSLTNNISVANPTLIIADAHACWTGPTPQTAISTMVGLSSSVTKAASTGSGCAGGVQAGAMVATGGNEVVTYTTSSGYLPVMNVSYFHN